MKHCRTTLCKCDNFVPIVVLGLSSDTDISVSAGDSAGNTRESAPSDRDVTLASSDRLQHLAEWLEEITEHLVDTRSTTSSSPSSSNIKRETQRIYTLSQGSKLRDLQATFMTRSRRNSKSHIPARFKFGDIITADHKILNEEGESRNNPRYDIEVQDLPLLEEKPKVIYTDNSLEF